MKLIGVGVAFVSLSLAAGTLFAQPGDVSAYSADGARGPSVVSAPAIPVPNELPADAPGLNPVRHGQAGAPAQKTMGANDDYVEPRFWLYNDNYFTWQPNSPGRTTTKFQISVRYDLAFIGPGKHVSFNLGYTQKSFWDLFAFDRSSPFVENDYKPELFVTYRPTPHDRVTEASVGIQHESNGLGKDSNVDQTGTSRGWNNGFVNLRRGFDRKIPTAGLELYLTLALRAWYARGADPIRLMDYIGHGTATVNLDIRLPEHPRFGEVALQAIAHERSIEGSIYFPLQALTAGFLRCSIYGQVFHGYAERLITFDQNVTNYYIGLGFI